MRTFPDANVLIAAHQWPNGKCAAILYYLLENKDHDLIIGEYVLAETKEKLLTRFRLSEDVVRNFEHKLRGGAEKPIQTTPTTPPAFYVRDRKDVWVLASALAAKADILLTGDKDLLVISDEVEKGTGMRIVSPGNFWALVKPVE